MSVTTSSDECRPRESSASTTSTTADGGDRAAPDPVAPKHESGSITASPGNSGRPTARWWMGVAVGLVVMLPIAWLLTYAALLPFFLGLFFFPLFGLIIGAVVYRVAAPARPHDQWAILLGTTLIVVVGWTVSIVNESRQMPVSLAKKVTAKTRDLGERTYAEHVGYVAGEIRQHLKDRYPPGGTLGYIRWIVTRGEFEKDEIAGVNRAIRESQRKLWWVGRATLSIGLLAFGVASQTLLLRHARDRAAARERPAETTCPSEEGCERT